MRPRAWLILAVATAAAAGAMLWRDAMIVHAERLPVAFDHGDHRGVGCVDCHHNFADDTGDGLCFDCHKRDHDLARSMQADFHDLCRGCHLDQVNHAQPGGPLRSCAACHYELDLTDIRERSRVRFEERTSTKQKLEARRRWLPDLSEFSP